MDQEKQLQEILELSRENNHLLKGVYRRARWGMFFWILRWALILGILLGAYYYVEPYVNKVTDTYQRTSDTVRGFQNTADKVNNNKAMQVMFGTATTTASSTPAIPERESIWDTLLRALRL